MNKSLFVWMLAFTLLFASLTPAPKAKAAPTWKQKANKVVAVAMQNKDKKYKAGKAGPDEFDCSGFTQYVYRTAINLNLPRTSREQAKTGTTIQKNHIRKGDLLFFQTNGKNISHVGIYIGDGQMIHAVNEQQNITISHLNESYWEQTFVRAQRVIQ